MKNKGVKYFTISLILLSLVVSTFFFASIATDGYSIFSSNKIDFAVTGQVGDFIGGLLGTVINASAFYFLYLTLNEQRLENTRQASISQHENFEKKFYELLALHRGNVSELRYTKWNEQNEARSVIKILVEEFIECYHETIRFTKMYPEMLEDGFYQTYLDKLKKIKYDNKIKASVKDMALFNLSYTFFYYGVTDESETTLFHVLKDKYKNGYTTKMKYFLQLKPKSDHQEGFERWKTFVGKDIMNMKKDFEIIYKNRRNFDSSAECPKVVYNLLLSNYYNGHQERLGHYFRHLFQSFKFISVQEILSNDEKYFYAKTLRAQLSTHEQLIVFFNSISSFGYKWEYLAEVEKTYPKIPLSQLKLITKYNLIKNVPGASYYQIKYRYYYPNVQYEFNEH